MKIGILHLSDIHFENENDWLVDKSELIARATVGSLFSASVENLVVVISGDIANKGQESQYDIATKFFRHIQDYLKQELNIPIYIILVPGNHDCDFGNENNLKLRKISINAILSDSKVCSSNDEIYEKCLHPQIPFFEFAQNFNNDFTYPNQPQIFYRLIIPAKDKVLVFNCFNTAWLTQKHEEPGKLIMPSHLLSEAELTVNNSLLSISIYHHPENWLSPESSSNFRSFLKKTSDLIFTGHEHEKNTYTQNQIQTGEHLQIHRAAALQERSSPKNSSFSVILLDFDNDKQKLFDYHWEEEKYSVSADPKWIDFVRNRHLIRGQFELNADFEKNIKSLNTLPITHARRQNVQLEELFIEPRLQVYSFTNILDGKPSKETIERDNFLSFIYDKKKILLYGETLQGKTTIARYLFLKSHIRGVIPVLIDGAIITKVKEKEINKIIKKSFIEQYDEESWEVFEQLEKSKRMIVIDDFGQSGLNQTQLQNVLGLLPTRFEYIVAVAHNNLRLQQYLENEEGEFKLSQFIQCEMRPMNRSERTSLVRKWVNLSNDFTGKKDLEIDINQKQQVIETAHETGIIPSYPSFLSGVLQLSDNANLTTVDQTKYGTIGFLYDSLITNRFQSLGEENIDLAQTYLLLGQMAYECYKREGLDISIEETETILRRYQSVYQQNIYSPKFIERIIETGIIQKQNSRLCFCNFQLRDFFTAHNYSQLLGDEDSVVVSHTYEEITNIIKTLTYESHTRILLFLVSKAYDKPRFIRQVLNVSKIIFAEFNPIDLNKDVEFLNQLKEDVSTPELLEEGSLLEKQEKLNNKFDEEPVNTLTKYSDKEKFLVEYREDLDEFVKAAITLKMIEVLGQLVRSFSSTLTGKIKEDIVSECINLSLRFLMGMYQFREEDIEELKRIIIELIKERHYDLSKHELVGRADNLLLFSFFGLTYGVIKKVSISLGHEDLKNIHTKVFDSNKNLMSYRMIEAALRLDHYQDPILEKIIKLGEELEDDNKFIWDVLQRLVATYLNYNSGLQAPQRQKLIDKFKLQHSPSYLLNQEKAERKYLPSQTQKFLPPETK